ncbi:MAG TPA: hypothetical protein VE911_05845 [Candidatus Nitrosopolaris sp.]|nr:hypothetical protein [Candidatus Nitrosopolaris sp.]
MARRTLAGNHAVCVSNRGFPDSLVVRRVYRKLPDLAAERRGLVRIVDESGEDYLYPAKLFLVIHLPPAATRALRAAS